MEKIEGRIPEDSPPFHASARATMWWSGIEQMASVHQTDWRTLGLDFLDDAKRGRAGLDQQLNYYAEYLEWAAGGRSQPVTEAAFEWLQRNRPTSDGPIGLCWGDAREGTGVPRLDGFPSHDETIARYEELMGRTAEHLDYYALFAGFRFAVIMIRVIAMAVAFELLPPDTDMGTNNIVTKLLAQMLGG